MCVCVCLSLWSADKPDDGATCHCRCDQWHCVVCLCLSFLPVPAPTQAPTEPPTTEPPPTIPPPKEGEQEVEHKYCNDSNVILTPAAVNKRKLLQLTGKVLISGGKEERRCSVPISSCADMVKETRPSLLVRRNLHIRNPIKILLCQDKIIKLQLQSLLFSQVLPSKCSVHLYNHVTLDVSCNINSCLLPMFSHKDTKKIFF